MLISLHLPKTAGSSFRAALEARFGDALQLDYTERPLHETPLNRNASAALGCVKNSLLGLPQPDIQCIHGHFLPLRYRLLKHSGHLQFVTWMRDPVQRLISHYYYWQRTYDAATAPRLHKLMMDEQWSLDTFADRNELRNVYSKFLWGFPLERFDFVGITEDYALELPRFATTILNTEIAPVQDNVNPEQAGEAYPVSDALRARIATVHSADIALYARALAMQMRRKNNQEH